MSDGIHVSKSSGSQEHIICLYFNLLLRLKNIFY